MGERQNSTIRYLSKFLKIVVDKRMLFMLLLIFVLFLAACDNKTYSKSVETRPIVETVDVYGEEEYTDTESKVVGKNCVEVHYSELNDSRFNITMEDPFWLGKPVPGETNYLKRVVHVYNGLDEVDTVYLDKVYYFNNTEVRRSKNPMKFLVSPKSVRTLYVMWDTQYDGRKDIGVTFTNNTAALGIETRIATTCVDKIEKFNVTKTREVKIGEETKVVEEEEIVRVKLKH